MVAMSHLLAKQPMAALHRRLSILSPTLHHRAEAFDYISISFILIEKLMGRRAVASATAAVRTGDSNRWVIVPPRTDLERAAW